MRHEAHLCARWEKRGMQCPFREFEKERERERETEGEGEAKAQLAEAVAVPGKEREIPWWLAFPLGEGVRRGLKKSGELFDVLAAAEEIAAAEARKIPVSATQNLFQALRPGKEVMGIAGAAAAAGVAGIAARRFGGGRFFEATRFREALATAQ